MNYYFRIIVNQYEQAERSRKSTTQSLKKKLLIGQNILVNLQKLQGRTTTNRNFLTRKPSVQSMVATYGRGSQTTVILLVGGTFVRLCHLLSSVTSPFHRRTCQGNILTQDITTSEVL